MLKVARQIADDCRYLVDDYRQLGPEARRKVKLVLGSCIAFTVFAVGGLVMYAINLSLHNKDLYVSGIESELEKKDRGERAVEFFRTGLER